MRIRSTAVIPAILLTVICSCSGPGNPQTDGKILRIGTTSTIRAANILKDTTLGLFAHISNPPLTAMSTDGEIVGLLVDDFFPAENGRAWTFRLKENLFWSDGKPVTSADICFSIKLTGWNNPYAYWIRENLEESQTPDERTVIFTFKKSYTRLPFEFATHNILPKHEWEPLENPNTYQHTGPYIGCGPYFISQTDLDSGLLIFEKNPYWRGSPPEIDTIEINLYNNIDVLCLALEKGEIDTFYEYAGTYPYANLRRLEADSRFGLLEMPDAGLVYLGFNLREGPLASPVLREAIAYAVDYEELVRLDLLGYGHIARRGFVPPVMPQFVDTPQLKYDPQKARTILRTAGYGDSDDDGILEDPQGQALKLKLPTQLRYIRTAELIQDYLGRIGIRVLPQIVDSSTWIALKESFKYDLTIARTTPWGMYMHAGWATGYFDSRRTGEGVLRTLDDPRFFALCDAILASNQPESTASTAESIQHYYSRNLPALALYWSTLLVPYKKSLAGWIVDPLYGIYNIDTFINLKTGLHEPE